MSATRRKQIQLNIDFFMDLYVYACRHGDPNDPQYKRICICAREKIDAMLRRDLYSLYKSGASEEARKNARRKYLDAIGLQDSFQWPDNLDVNVTHSFPEIL